MSANPLATLYAEALSSLRTDIRAQWAWPSPEAGFALFVLQSLKAESPLPQVGDWPVDDKLTHAPSLAAAGFAMSCGIALDRRAAWLAGIERLQGREAFPSDRQSFAYRPIELLGIAIGVSLNSANESLVRWMSDVLFRARKIHASDLWASGLQLAAERIVGVTGLHPRSIEECSRLDELALYRWLSKRFAFQIDVRKAATSLLKQGALALTANCELTSAAVIFHSLRDVVHEVIESSVETNWQVGREQRDAEELVTALCRRFHLFAEQLQSRHGGRPPFKIDDEYDVQDLLCALLKLHFDDVRPEEVTPSVAGKSGRMDFLIKQERIVVEAKMTRKGLDQKKVGDELIIDMRRYQAHPDVRTLICIVYDLDRYCENPAALETDLSGTRDNLKTVVVVCPRGL